MNEIVAFNQTKADLAKYKAAEEKLVFDHNDPQGEKDLRSHIYKLRQARSAFEKLRVSTKAEALRACKNVDSQAKVILSGFTEMIDARNKPLKEIAEREEAEKQAFLDEQQAKREKEEADRLAVLEAKEAELEELKAKVKAEEDAKAQAEREQKIAEDAKIEAEQEAGRKLRLAEEKRVADIAEVERKAKQEAKNREALVAAKALAAKQETARLDKIEADRIADLEHRTKVETAIDESIWAILNELRPASAVGKSNVDIATRIVADIKGGKIPNVTINY